jgi:hypothetical protein
MEITISTYDELLTFIKGMILTHDAAIERFESAFNPIVVITFVLDREPYLNKAK